MKRIDLQVEKLLKSRSTVEKKDKGQQLAEIEGYSNLYDLISDYQMESVIPGICMNQGCDYTTGVEPDQGRGWCEVCDTNSVMSAFRLMGII